MVPLESPQLEISRTSSIDAPGRFVREFLIFFFEGQKHPNINIFKG